jgi:hypothetical protein
MKRYVFIALIVSLFLSGYLFAQEEIGANDPQQLGIEEAQQKLKEISIDKFENEGYWNSTISSDEGYAVTRLFEGSPAGKTAIPDEENLDPAPSDRYVLGTRVDFLRRGYSSINLYPTRPIPVEGITKTISIWVAGRNFNHELHVLIQDVFGRKFDLYMGKLNFQGWKQLTVAVPPQPGDGQNGIVQRNYHYNSTGIKIIGFRIDCDPVDAYGTYYVYLDDLRVVTDLFAEDNRDEDDMSDAW